MNHPSVRTSLIPFIFLLLLILLSSLVAAFAPHLHLPLSCSSNAHSTNLHAHAHARAHAHAHAHARAQTLPNKPKLFIFGLGYVGSNFVRSLKTPPPPSTSSSNENENDYEEYDFFSKISGTTSSPPSSDLLTSLGSKCSVHVFRVNTDVNGTDTDTIFSSDMLRDLNEATHILITVPPLPPLPSPNLSSSPLDNESITKLLTQTSQNNFQKATVTPNLRSLTFLSTTGVYGNHNGSWVDEASLLLAKPGSKAAAFILGEGAWFDYVWKNKSCERGGCLMNVFRLSGIYGKGRSALDVVRKFGLSPSTSGDSGSDSGGGDDDDEEEEDNEVNNKTPFTSRIHVDDICQALLSKMRMDMDVDMDMDLGYAESAQKPNEPFVVNLSDDKPSKRTTALLHAARLLNLNLDDVKMLSIKDGSSSSGLRMKRMESNNKRVGNEKLKREVIFGNNLIYPTVKEGLSRIFEVEEASCVRNGEDGDGENVETN